MERLFMGKKVEAKGLTPERLSRVEDLEARYEQLDQSCLSQQLHHLLPHLHRRGPRLLRKILPIAGEDDASG